MTMRRLFLAALLLCCAVAGAATLTGSMEIRIKSVLSDIGALGQTADVIDYAWPVMVQDPTLVYHADRAVTPAAPITLGLVGSMTNALGETLSFSTVQGIYVQNLISSATLTVSGLATATISPLGFVAFQGDQVVASISDRISITTTATGSARIWLIGK